jgi:hypothetical protein
VPDEQRIMEEAHIVHGSGKPMLGLLCPVKPGYYWMLDERLKEREERLQEVIDTRYTGAADILLRRCTKGIWVLADYQHLDAAEADRQCNASLFEIKMIAW